MNNLGNIVNQLRKQRGWSLNELSSRSDIPVSTLHGIEKGSNPSFEKITKLASALGVELSVLLQNTNYTEVTSMNKEDIEFLAPSENYSKYIETFSYFGYKVVEHLGTYIYGEQKEGFIYDIVQNDKLVITLSLDGFCELGEKISQYKQTFDRSLNLLVNDTLSNWKFLYEVMEKEENQK